MYVWIVSEVMLGVFDVRKTLCQQSADLFWSRNVVSIITLTLEA